MNRVFILRLPTHFRLFPETAVNRILVLLGLICFANGGLQSVLADDSIENEPTWTPLTKGEMQSSVKAWLASTEISSQRQNEILTKLESGASGNQEPLDAMVDAILAARPELIAPIGQSVSLVDDGFNDETLNGLLGGPEPSKFVIDNLRLFIGRELARQKFYDTALQILESLDPNRVCDPACLLFYRGLMQHQLLMQEECEKTLKRLLERESELPRRYAVLANMMLADIRSLKPGSLDEISRMMRDIRRRTEVYESGRIVLTQEKSVVEKLDQLISQLESQAAKKSSGQGSASQPLQNSGSVSGQGDGEVVNKQQGDGGSWGDLPPAERAAALAELTKRMPPHYRPVVEEYFRQLANQQDRQP